MPLLSTEESFQFPQQPLFWLLEPFLTTLIHWHFNCPQVSVPVINAIVTKTLLNLGLIATFKIRIVLSAERINGL